METVRKAMVRSNLAAIGFLMKNIRVVILAWSNIASIVSVNFIPVSLAKNMRSSCVYNRC